MKIAYLINTYPMVSLSFIRREIQCLEELGLSIYRFSIRNWHDTLVDESDKEEKRKTKVILGVGILGLLWHSFLALVTNPIRLVQALFLTIKIGWRSEKGLLVHFAYLMEACVLSSWLRKDDIRHIHVHFASNSTTVALLCSVLGEFTYSFTIHGPEEFDKIGAIALPEKIKRAKFVAAISSYGRSQVYRWCDYHDWHKVRIIRCGLEDELLNSEITPIRKDGGFVCVGRLSPQKGQLLLIQALGQLKHKGIECKLTLVGDGELKTEIENLAEQFNVSEQVTITGWATSEEVKAEIKQARWMLLPSFAEGLPVVIMEALALGRPVISTYVAGIPELVVKGKTGWLIPAGDVETLASVMEKALLVPTRKLEQMGKIGKDKVAELHNIKTECQKLADLFSKYL